MTVADCEPRPGAIVLVPFAGPRLVRRLIIVGQALLAGAPSRYSHAAIVTGGGWAVEACWPRARMVPMSELMARRPLAYLDLPHEAEGRRDAVVAAALDLVGVPYQGWAYVWIGLAKLGIRPGWMRRKLASPRALICSALVDYAWMLAGVQLFNDGRLLGAVTPGDIAHVGTVHHTDTGPWVLP